MRSRRARSRTLGRSELGDAAVPSVPAPPHRSKTRHRGFRRGLRVVLFRHLRRGSRGGRSLGHVRGRRRGPDGGARDAGDHQGVQARRENRLENSTASDGEWAYSADDAKTRRATLQALAARVASGGLLASLPDPVQAFRGSRFRQTQKIALARDASLVVVDWIVAGRAAFHGGGAGGFTSGRGGGLAPSEDPKLRVEGGERWRFESYASETEVLLDGAVYAVESASLRGEDPGGGTLAERMGATHALATAIIAGPRAAAAARRAREVAAPIVEAMARGAARGVAGGSREDGCSPPSATRRRRGQTPRRRG